MADGTLILQFSIIDFATSIVPLMIPVLRPLMPPIQCVVPFLDKLEQANQWSNFGALSIQLRDVYARKLGVDFEQVQLCANATLAIEGAARVLNIPEWSVQNWTFAATGLGIQRASQSMMFHDVTFETWMRKTDNLTNAGSVVVVPFGRNFSLNEIPLVNSGIIDAAASLANFPNLTSLSPNQVVVFSLHATKPLGCGEGSVLVFGDQNQAEQFRIWTNFGFNNSRVSEVSQSTNAKMSEIDSAFALAALSNWDMHHQKILELRKLAEEVSINLNIAPCALNNQGFSPYWIVQFDNRQVRDRVKLKLLENEIETRIWWSPPLSMMKAFTNVPIEDTLDISLSLSETTLGLPFHSELDEITIRRIGSLVEIAMRTI